MPNKERWRRILLLGSGVLLFLAGPAGVLSLCRQVKAGPLGHGGDGWTGWAFFGRESLHGPQALAGTWYLFPGAGSPADGACANSCPDVCTNPGQRRKWRHVAAKAPDACCPDGCGAPCELGGSWFWMRSPEEERVAVSGLFNRYCIRCHGVDGRGVWDIPGIPDFTNARWQVSRSDDQIARIIIEGRGAVMPTFRGTLTLEEAWAMARYLRTFLPGSEASRPEMGRQEKEKTGPPTEPLPPPKKMP
jgi:hypothetical protein